MTPRERIILAGGRGFLGTLLTTHFAARGHEVLVLTRNPRPGDGPVRDAAWDGKTAGDWANLLEGAAAVVNLAGRSVNCRYHARNRRLILESRVQSTRALGQAIRQCARPPRVWLNSSTATIYKHSFDQAMDEATGEIRASPEAKDAFSIDVACAWERAFEEACVPATRKGVLRTAMVLGTGKNSVFPMLRRLVRLGLGGNMADGRQFVSWIHQTDYCRAIEWLIGRDDFSGTVNLAAPNPVPNREMMRVFRQLAGVPFGLPATRWMLEVGAVLLRTETELILKSRRVVPNRLVAAGFEFRFPDLRGALEDLWARP